MGLLRSPTRGKPARHNKPATTTSALTTRVLGRCTFSTSPGYYSVPRHLRPKRAYIGEHASCVNRLFVAIASCGNRASSGNRAYCGNRALCGERACPALGCEAALKPENAVPLDERGDLDGAAAQPNAGQARSPQQARSPHNKPAHHTTSALITQASLPGHYVRINVPVPLRMFCKVASTSARSEAAVPWLICS